MQGSPSDKDIIDLYGHYGLEATAVNVATRRRYAAKMRLRLDPSSAEYISPSQDDGMMAFLRYICYPMSC